MNLKIAEISEKMDSLFNSDLSETRKKFWQEKLSLVFQVEWSLIETDNLAVWLKENKNLNAILFSEEFSPQILKNMREIPTEVKNTAVADCIVKQLGHYIPRILLKEALRIIITETNSKLDSRAMVYITGAGEVIKPLVSMVVQLGFSKINLVDADLDRLMNHAENLRKKYFGINFLLIQDAELTLQPSNGSLLINTIGAGSDQLLQDISYMNFLKRDGLIADLPFSKVDNPVVSEGKDAGIPLVTSLQLQAYKDYELLSLLEIPNLPSKRDYVSLWSAFLNQDKGPVT